MLKRAAYQFHRKSYCRVYYVWRGMRYRCLDEKNGRYHRYGGRGIGICERWLKFTNFYEDMGEPPYGMTLERIDNDGDYRPDNCRWATPLEQGNNRSTNRIIEAFGEQHTMSEWARLVGMTKSTLKWRLQAGWTEESALSTPVRT